MKNLVLAGLIVAGLAACTTSQPTAEPAPAPAGTSQPSPDTAPPPPAQ